MFFRYKWVMLVYALGVMYLCILLSFSKEEFYYSEDGGLKFLMLSEYIQGDWNSTLDIPHTSWEESLWQQGMYPFRAPFVYQTEYGRVCAFPPFFSMLSAPFYALFGYKGLYIIPCVSVLLLWGLFISLGIKMMVRPFTLLLSFIALVFASSLTVYGAIFWEHTLAALCVFASVYFCIVYGQENENSKHNIRSLLYGLVAGFAVWLRPEALFFILFFVLWKVYDVVRYKKISRLYFIGAVVLMGIGFVTYNMFAYHHPMGMHAAQILDNDSVKEKVMRAFHILAVYGAKGILFDPIVVSVFVICLLYAKNIYADHVQNRHVILILLVGVLIFYVGSIWILPNTGGLNWGIRYALVCTPTLYVLFMLVFDKYVANSRNNVYYVVVILLLIGYGVVRNSYFGAKHLYGRNNETKLAIYNFLQTHKLDVVLVSQTNMAGEFYGIMKPSAILLTETREQLDAYLNHPETKGLDFALLYEINNPYSKVKLKQEDLVDFYEDTVIGDFIIYKQKKLLGNQ